MSLRSRIVGRGPDIAFLHGWSLHSGIWDGLIPMLERDYRMHLIDLPGHGASPWDPSIADLDGLAESVATAIPHAATVVGWSLGGIIAQRLASRPDIKALVLISSTPKFVASDEWRFGMEPAVLNNFAAKLQTNYSRTVSDFLALQVQGQERAAATLRELKSRMLAGAPPDLLALQVTLDILRDSDTRSELPSIRQPTLVVAGEYDRLTPPQAGEYLTQNIPSAVFRLFPRAAHAPFVSHKEEFSSALKDFLQSQASVPASQGQSA